MNDSSLGSPVATRSILSIDDATLPLYCGVDVGGTSIKIGLVDRAGHTIAYDKIATEEQRGPTDAIARISTAVECLIRKSGATWTQVVAIGLGTPGSMDIPRGMVLAPPNLPHWVNFPIRDALSRACDRPVVFSNDANAAAYGEFWIGAGQQHNSLIMLTLGTGVGGGIIVDGTAVEGTNSFGAEVGHILIDTRADARCCVWGGGRGQLEAYASASAVTARTTEALSAHPQSSLHRRLQSGDALSPLMICEEAELGDSFALEIILETARYLGLGIVTLVHTLDPGLVILGGAMNFGGESTTIGKRFLEQIKQEFESRAFDVVIRGTTIGFASLGGDAGYIGAAGLAQKAHPKQHQD